MRPSRPSRRSLAAFALGAALAVGATVAVWHPGASASAAAERRATCSASVDIDAGGVHESVFETAFTVGSQRRFADDRSSALREESLAAELVGESVDVSYAKDISTTEGIRLELSVTFVGDRGVQSGRSVFSTAGQPDRVATYAVTCRR